MAKILHRGDISDGFMRGEGKFEIFPLDEWHEPEMLLSTWLLKSQLINIEYAGRTAHRSVKKDVTFETAEAFVRKYAIEMGHESTIEHSILTVRFSNVSRGFTHEVVRHRVGVAFTQESTRYCDYAEGELDLQKAELCMVVPPHKELPYDGRREFAEETLDHYEWIYKALRGTYGGEKDIWEPEDARQYLPIGIVSQIVVTANFREWRHIMKMRTQKVAHWEIRYMMCDLLARLKEIIPVIFEDFRLSDEPDKKGYRYAIQRR